MTADLTNAVVSDTADLKEAMRSIKKTGAGIVFVRDANARIVGVLTDGDIRAALLEHENVHAPVASHMTRNFVFAQTGATKDQAAGLLDNKIRVIPILDAEHRLVEVLRPSYNGAAVVEEVRTPTETPPQRRPEAPVASEPVYLLGTGGFATELFDLLADSGIPVGGFIGGELQDHLRAPWIGHDEKIDTLPREATIFVAVAEPVLRQKLAERVLAKGRRLGSLIHRFAWVASSAQVEDGVVVYPNATVHARVRLERSALINTNATIGHDAIIGAFGRINPSASIGGAVKLAPGTVVGMAASIRERLSVGPGVVIGAGATVVTDLNEPGTYIGTPARLLRR